MANLKAAETPQLRERITALSRYKRRIAFVTAGAMTASVLLAFLLPPTYQSMATILIEQQEIPQDLVRSTITSFADQRVQVISQRVMTSQNLLQIIERYDLYANMRKNKPREALLKRMRGDVHMQMVSADVIDPRSGRPTRANIAFTIAYENRTPEVAYKVASELTTLYLNENTTSRTKQAEQAASFLKEEADRLSAEIAGLDAKMADFKSKHAESLPELSGLNMTVMDRTDTELRDVENRIGTVDQQRLLMEAQLAQLNPSSSLFADTGQRILAPADRLKAARSQLAGLSARYSPDHPEVLAARREVAGLEAQVGADDEGNDVSRQLDAARGRLAAVREKYSPEHPDVKRLEREVAALEAESVRAPAPHKARLSKPDNPAYIQVKGQLDSLLAERDSLLEKQRELHNKLNQYESRLANAPEVERNYRSLVRDAENARVKYQEVRAKEMEAHVSQNLETERKGERFTLIEPPLPPEEPISPKRWFILISGMFVSLLLGLGSGWIKEAASGAVRGPGDLRELLTVPPLATVPTIVTAGETTAHRRFAWRAVTGGGAALLISVTAFHFLVLPLDVLWDVVVRRFGV